MYISLSAISRGREWLVEEDVDALRADEPFEVLVGIAGFDRCRGSLGFDLQFVAARLRRGAAPVFKVGIGAAATRTHGSAIDGLLESL